MTLTYYGYKLVYELWGRGRGGLNTGFSEFFSIIPGFSDEFFMIPGLPEYFSKIPGSGCFPINFAYNTKCLTFKETYINRDI